MKLFASLLAAVLLVTACSMASVPERMDRLVTKAEENHDKYTADDWQDFKTEFQDLLYEYSENKDKYTSEEKNLVTKCVVRYVKLLAKLSVKDVLVFVDVVEGMLPEVWGMVKDLAKEYIRAKIGDGLIGSFLDLNEMLE